MTEELSAAMLRRWAMQCASRANDPLTSGDERERLLKMKHSLLDLAKQQDWLDGAVSGAPVARNENNAAVTT